MEKFETTKEGHKKVEWGYLPSPLIELMHNKQRAQVHRVIILTQMQKAIAQFDKITTDPDAVLEFYYKIHRLLVSYTTGDEFLPSLGAVIMKLQEGRGKYGLLNFLDIAPTLSEQKEDLYKLLNAAIRHAYCVSEPTETVEQGHAGFISNVMMFLAYLIACTKW